MRTEGAFLVSANLSGGKVEKVQIEATVSGMAKIKNPFGTQIIRSSHPYEKQNDYLIFNLRQGEILKLSL